MYCVMYDGDKHPPATVNLHANQANLNPAAPCQQDCTATSTHNYGGSSNGGNSAHCTSGGTSSNGNSKNTSSEAKYGLTEAQVKQVNEEFRRQLASMRLASTFWTQMNAPFAPVMAPLFLPSIVVTVGALSKELVLTTLANIVANSVTVLLVLLLLLLLLLLQHWHSISAPSPAPAPAPTAGGNLATFPSILNPSQVPTIPHPPVSYFSASVGSEFGPANYDFEAMPTFDLDNLKSFLGSLDLNF